MKIVFNVRENNQAYKATILDKRGPEAFCEENKDYIIVEMDNYESGKNYKYENGKIIEDIERTEQLTLASNQSKCKKELFESDFAVLPDNPLGLSSDQIETLYNYRKELRNFDSIVPTKPDFLK